MTQAGGERILFGRWRLRLPFLRRRSQLELVKSTVPELDQIGPGSFDTKAALKRILTEENPPLGEIFGIEPQHQLTISDIGAQFFGEGGQFAWQTKAVLNTLRRAATDTIADILVHEPLNIPLPSPQTEITPDVVTDLQKRSVATFDLMRPIAERLGLNYEPRSFPYDDVGTKPPEDTDFERALGVLKDYFGDELFGNTYAFHQARQDTLRHVIRQELTRNLAPSYIKLIADVYHRDRSQFSELVTEYPTFELFQHLVSNSDAIMLRGASHTVFDLGIFSEVTIEYDESIRAAHENPSRNVGLVFKPDAFEMRRSKKGSGFTLAIKDSAMEKIIETHKERSNTGMYNVMETGCPASSKLIRTIINRAVAA